MIDLVIINFLNSEQANIIVHICFSKGGRFSVSEQTKANPTLCLIQSTTKLYKQELPAMSFAADTGKESDFLRNCTMSGWVEAVLIVIRFLISSACDLHLV